MLCPLVGAMIRSMIRSRRHRAIRALVVVALCLLAALAIVTSELTKARVHAIEQFAAGDVRGTARGLQDCEAGPPGGEGARPHYDPGTPPEPVPHRHKRRARDQPRMAVLA